MEEKKYQMSCPPFIFLINKRESIGVPYLNSALLPLHLFMDLALHAQLTAQTPARFQEIPKKFASSHPLFKALYSERL